MNEMNITSAQYQSTQNGNEMIVATIDGIEMTVPNNAPGNRHYDAIMKAVEAGELTIEEAE